MATFHQVLGRVGGSRAFSNQNSPNQNSASAMMALSSLNPNSPAGMMALSNYVSPAVPAPAVTAPAVTAPQPVVPSRPLPLVGVGRVPVQGATLGDLIRYLAARTAAQPASGVLPPASAAARATMQGRLLAALWGGVYGGRFPSGMGHPFWPGRPSANGAVTVPSAANMVDLRR